MFSLKNRVLVVASATDEDCAVAVASFGSANADKITLEDFKANADTPHSSQYGSISFFASVRKISEFIDQDLMSRFYAVLHPGGTINVHLAAPQEIGDAIIKQFKKTSIYSGFISPLVVRDKENAQLRRTLQLVAQRPSWGEGAASRFTDDGLIDESTLLDNEVYIPMGKGKSDCSTKVQACANCTCGRKELEVELGAVEAKKRLENAVVRSSCGSCYLGDAFRCSGCPYKGLPAFKPGEKIELDVDQTNQGQTHLLMSETVATEDQNLTGSIREGPIKLLV